MKRTPNSTMVIGLVAAVFVIAWIGLFYQFRKQVTWRPTYSAKDDQPFGMKLTRQRLPDLFPEVPIETIKEELYWFLFDTTVTDQLLILANAQIPLDSFDVEALMLFVEEGNQVFMAANRYPALLLDTLGLVSVFSDLSFHAAEDSLRLQFAAGQSSYTYPRRHIIGGFTPDLPPEGQVLATDQDGHHAFIWMPHGEGAFWLCRYPQALTNYYMVDSLRVAAIAQTLGRIPVPTGIWWDEYYKVENLARENRRRNQGSRSDRPYSLKAYLADKPALAWGIGLLIASLLLYALFESKRSQRLVPTYESPPNTTLAFVETMGRLYYQHEDHRNLALKMIQAWRDYVRTHFFVDVNRLQGEGLKDQDLVALLAAKSGQTQSEITRLLNLMIRISHQLQLSDEGLIQLHDALAEFYTSANT